MLNDSSDSDVQALVAREEIRHLLTRYCRGVDRKLWDEVAACYHDDAYDSHGTYAGGLSGLLEWFKDRHATVDTSIHFIGNVHIEAMGDHAVAETYFFHLRRVPTSEVGGAQISHRCAEGTCEGSLVEIHMFGRYLDKFELRAGVGWRISSRHVVADTRTLYCVGADFPMSGGWDMGSRGPDDLSRGWFGAEGLAARSATAGGPR